MRHHLVNHGWKEHPKARQIIEERGYYPLVYVSGDRLVWDGVAITRTEPPGDESCSFGALGKQLKKMICEGYWPELRCVEVDAQEWWRVHDLLKEAIEGPTFPESPRWIAAWEEDMELIQKGGLKQWEPAAKAA